MLHNEGMNAMSRSLDELLAKLRDLLPTLRTQYRIRTLEVFGSFVRGEERAASDNPQAVP